MFDGAFLKLFLVLTISHKYFMNKFMDRLVIYLNSFLSFCPVITLNTRVYNTFNSLLMPFQLVSNCCSVITFWTYTLFFIRMWNFGLRLETTYIFQFLAQKCFFFLGIPKARIILNFWQMTLKFPAYPS